MRNLVLAAVAATALATSAGAVVTVTSVQGPDGSGQTVLFDFNTPGSGTTGLTGNYSITTGTAAQLAAAPLGDLTPYLVVPGTTGSLPGSATLNLGGSYSNLSFYWGSIDTYNSATFYSGANGTGTVIGTVGGVSAGGPANGAQLDPANNRRVFFNFGGATAQSVVFTSSQRAFEIDDVSTAAVPEPTVWATLLTGFGLIGLSMRRRRIVSLTA